jgi:hypothetical protein
MHQEEYFFEVKIVLSSLIEAHTLHPALASGFALSPRLEFGQCPFL